MKSQVARLLSTGMCGHHVKETSKKNIIQKRHESEEKRWKFQKTSSRKDIAHVAMHGTAAPHDMLPGTDGDSDNQNVPPSSNSTFIEQEEDIKKGIVNEYLT